MHGRFVHCHALLAEESLSLLGYCGKPTLKRSRNGAGGLGHPDLAPVLRVLMFAANEPFKVQMGTGGQAGRTHQTDLMSLLYALSLLDADALEVSISAFTAIVVFYAYIIAVITLPPCKRDRSSRDAPNGSTSGSTVIHALVMTQFSQDRMQAPTEPGSDSKDSTERTPQEIFLKRYTFIVIILVLVILIFK